MPKAIGEENVFKKEPYKSIMFLLTFIPDGLEPHEILIALADEKTLIDLKQKKKIKYDIKKVKRELEERIPRSEMGFRDYSKYIQKGYIAQNILSNKLSKLRSSGAVIKENNRYKPTDEFLRSGKGVLFMDDLRSVQYGHGTRRDIAKSDSRKKGLDVAYSKIFSRFSPEEKEHFKKYFDEMKNSITGINRIITRKIQRMFEEHVEEFYKKTKSKRIKKALDEGEGAGLFQIINIPYYYSLCYKQELTWREFYIYTGLAQLLAINDFLLGAPSEDLTKRIKEVEKKVNETETQYDTGILSEEQYSEKRRELLYEVSTLDVLNKNKKKLAYLFDGERIKEKSEKKKKEFEERKLIIPNPIAKEIANIEYLVFEQTNDYGSPKFLKSYSKRLVSFSREWSKHFFLGKDYNFTIEEIWEIVYWCWKKIPVMEDVYHFSTDIAPKECAEYLNKVCMGLEKEIPYKPFILFK